MPEEVSWGGGLVVRGWEGVGMGEGLPAAEGVPFASEGVPMAEGSSFARARVKIRMGERGKAW